MTRLMTFIFFILSFQSLKAEIKPAQKEIPKANHAIRVKAPTKTEDFDSQLVEGQVYRPDLSVVTGDTDNHGFGVLRLRKNFKDHAKNDHGELIE